MKRRIASIAVVDIWFIRIEKPERTPMVLPTLLLTRRTGRNQLGKESLGRPAPGPVVLRLQNTMTSMKRTTTKSAPYLNLAKEYSLRSGVSNRSAVHLSSTMTLGTRSTASSHLSNFTPLFGSGSPSSTSPSCEHYFTCVDSGISLVVNRIHAGIMCVFLFGDYCIPCA